MTDQHEQYCAFLSFSTNKSSSITLDKRDGLPEIARKITEELKWDFNVIYDEKML